MAPRVTRDFGIGPFERSATRWLENVAGRPAPSTPARAATVMLVRGEPLEVFMIERSPSMDFAPSTWVFPGGRVDPSDAGVADAPGVSLLLGPGGAEAWAQRLCLDVPDAVAVVGCVLRELFEEAGVLLASDRADRALIDTSGPEWAERREAVEAHRATFVSAVEGVQLRGDLLSVVDRWVTPEFEKRRFDTWFFVAEVPMGGSAEAVSREATCGRWVKPSAMLDECARGEVQLLPPTMTALQRLSRCRSAVEAGKQAEEAAFEPTHPRVLRGPDGLYLQAEVNL